MAERQKVTPLFVLGGIGRIGRIKCCGKFQLNLSMRHHKWQNLGYDIHIHPLPLTTLPYANVRYTHSAGLESQASMTLGKHKWNTLANWMSNSFSSDQDTFLAGKLRLKLDKGSGFSGAFYSCCARSVRLSPFFKYSPNATARVMSWTFIIHRSTEENNFQI